MHIRTSFLTYSALYCLVAVLASLSLLYMLLSTDWNSFGDENSTWNMQGFRPKWICHITHPLLPHKCSLKPYFTIIVKWWWSDNYSQNCGVIFKIRGTVAILQRRGKWEGASGGALSYLYLYLQLNTHQTDPPQTEFRLNNSKFIIPILAIKEIHL